MNIGIVGAGVTGLTAGYELVKKGHKVTVFESENEYGGLVGTVETGGKKLEKFYHHIFAHDTHIINLADELGLGSKLMWKHPSNGIYINKKLYPFTSPLDLLRFKELSLVDRIRMGLLVYMAKLTKDWKKIEDMNCREWIIKNAGINVYEKVWGPLLNSKFDIDTDKVSAVWIWNKFKLRGSTRGKNLNRELLGYMNGSFGILYQKLAERIEQKGGSVICQAKVTEIIHRGNGKLDIVAADITYNFDSVIVTTAPEVLKKINIDFPESYVEKLQKIKYKSNICMILELYERLSPYYWITVAEKEFPFVLVIEHTNMVSAKEYGSHIVYLSRYLDKTDDLYSADNEEIKTLFLDYLKKMFPEWDESKIKNVQINRAELAQPVVVTGYSNIILDFKTPVKNLYLADMAQIYPEDRGQNYAIRMGREVARYVNY